MLKKKYLVTRYLKASVLKWEKMRERESNSPV